MLRASIESALTELAQKAGATPRQVEEAAKAVIQLHKAAIAIDNVYARTIDQLRSSGGVNGPSHKANIDDFAEAKHQLAVLRLAASSAEYLISQTESRIASAIGDEVAKRHPSPDPELSPTLQAASKKRKD